MNKPIYIITAKANKIVESATTKKSRGGIDTEYQLSIKTKNPKYIYRSSMALNLDLITLNELFPNAIVELRCKKIVTRAIIDVDFTKPLHHISDTPSYYYSKGRIMKSAYKGIVGRKTYHCKAGVVKKAKSYGSLWYRTSELRLLLYQRGFYFEGHKYVVYKRSASKAKNGHTLFIREDYYKQMMEWSRFGKNGLVYEEGEDCDDFPGLMAYEALTLSGIEHTIDIPPKSILFIEDKVYRPIVRASVTRIVDNEVVVSDDDITLENTIFDGQSLLDKSVFDAYEFSRGKGMMLLRNRMFKSAAINTNLRERFEEYALRTGKRTVVDHITGEVKNIEDILLVTTPSSLKMFKFAYKMFGKKDQSEKPDEKENRKCVAKFWLNEISSTFGICKTEKGSRWENCNRLSYQMVNSLPLLESDLRELTADEVEYINLLRRDVDVFMHHIKAGTPNLSRQFVYNLLLCNPDIQHTALYRDFRDNTIRHYVDSVRAGEILVRDSDYSVMFGNVFEMLMRATGEDINETVHHGYEVWCPRYDDGEKLTGFRNPHICQGNVALLTNKRDERIDRWFNLTPNIVIVNSTDCDVLDRLQGADFDSDCVLLSSHPVLVRMAKACQSFLTPIKDIKSTKIIRPYNAASRAQIDTAIAENLIGQIVNASQMLNSTFWSVAYKKDRRVVKQDKGTIEFIDENEMYDMQEHCYVFNKILNYTSLLSSASQMEIDKAKKTFHLGYDEDRNKEKTMSDILDQIRKDCAGHPIYAFSKLTEKRDIGGLTTSVANEIMELEKRRDELDDEKKRQKIDEMISSKTMVDRKVNVRPRFFRHFTSKKYNAYRTFNTPMDFLDHVLDEGIDTSRGKRSIPISSILRKIPVDDSAVNRHQIDEIHNIAKDSASALKALSVKGLKGEERWEKIREIEDNEKDAVDKIGDMKITNATMLRIIKRCYGVKSSGPEGKNLKKSRTTIMKLLFAAQPERMLECFKSIMTPNVVVIEESAEGNLRMFGKNYKKIIYIREEVYPDFHDYAEVETGTCVPAMVC